MCAQLESCLVVLDPGKRRLGTAPIIDRLCARIHNTPATFLGVGDGGGSGLHQNRISAATMPTDWRTKARGSAHAETELLPVRDGFAMG